VLVTIGVTELPGVTVVRFTGVARGHARQLRHTDSHQHSANITP